MNLKKRFLFLIVMVLVLNLIWEFSHYQLYIDLSGIALVPHLLLASFTDVLIVSVIFLIVSLRNKGFGWISRPAGWDYFMIVFFAMMVAIFIELRALRIEGWMYKEIMPTVFGVGLSPLVQLFVTGIVALWLVKFMPYER